MTDPEAVADIADYRRRKWLRLVSEARESGMAFRFNQELEQPARVLQFPLRLVDIEPPEPVA